MTYTSLLNRNMETINVVNKPTSPDDRITPQKVRF